MSLEKANWGLMTMIGEMNRIKTMTEYSCIHINDLRGKSLRMFICHQKSRHPLLH